MHIVIHLTQWGGRSYDCGLKQGHACWCGGGDRSPVEVIMSEVAVEEAHLLHTSSANSQHVETE